MKDSREITRPYSSMSSIWGSGWNHMGSKEFGWLCPLALLIPSPIVFPLSSFYIVCSAFFSGLHMILESPKSWGFYNNLGFIFSVSKNGPSISAYRESDLATHCLALVACWDLGISFHGPHSCIFYACETSTMRMICQILLPA